MNRTGTIKLFYKDELIALMDYEGPQSRIRILDTWKSIYGKKFSECAIQYRPDITDYEERKKYSTAKRIANRHPRFERV